MFSTFLQISTGSVSLLGCLFLVSLPINANFAHVVVRISTKSSYAGKITRFHALLVKTFGFRNTPPNDFCYISTCKKLAIYTENVSDNFFFVS